MDPESHGRGDSAVGGDGTAIRGVPGELESTVEFKGSASTLKPSVLFPIQS
jgi:hypothetical protein